MAEARPAAGKAQGTWQQQGRLCDPAASCLRDPERAMEGIWNVDRTIFNNCNTNTSEKFYHEGPEDT